MRKLAIALAKGGVGKTTTAVNLAAGLARQERRVLLVDVDTQGQVSRSLGVDSQVGLAEFVTGDVAISQACLMVRKNLWLLAGGRNLAGLKRLITQKDFGGEQTLREALQALDQQYDYVIMDTAPGWDALTVNVLFYAYEVLSPVSLEVMSLQGLMEFVRNLASIQRYHSELNLSYVLPTFYDRRVKKSGEIFYQLAGYYQKQICEPVRYNVRLSEAPGYGQTIFEYAPSSSGAEDYRRLCERVIRDEGKSPNVD